MKQSARFDSTLRRKLNDEVHLRPYDPVLPPHKVSYLAVQSGPAHWQAEWAHLHALVRHFGRRAPQDLETLGRNTFRIDLGAFRLKVERHHEYTRYQFMRREEVSISKPFAAPVTDRLPPDWLAGLPGRLLVASHISILPDPSESDDRLIARVMQIMEPRSLTGSIMGRSRNRVFTDFRLGADGFSRLLIFARTRSAAQTGRLLWRLLEIETYRMLALLALPDARRLLTTLPAEEERLVRLTNAIVEDGGRSDVQLFDEVSEFAAMVESLLSTHYRRFSASRAYFDLVEQRLQDLRERPIPQIPQLGTFLRRRLEPARDTCQAIERWLDQLANRTSRTVELLRTRVEIGLEKQNRSMLETMSRRTHLQLRMQQAAELFSVTIFTYYGIQLLAYWVEAVAAIGGWHPNMLLIKAAAIPLLAGGAWYGLQHARRAFNRRYDNGETEGSERD